MNDFLLEIFSEEIPARLQEFSAKELENSFINKFKEKLKYDYLKAFVTPRRLTIIIRNIDHINEDLIEEKKGPAINAPESAISGFLKANKISKEEAVIKNINNIDYYYFITQKDKVDIAELLSRTITEILKEFPWPKSMRWGINKDRWSRPIKNILAILNGEIIAIEFAKLKSNNKVSGHRFMANISKEIHSIDEYLAFLNDSFVILDQQKRKQQIRLLISNKAKEINASEEIDENLLNEVTGLVEWPVLITGEIKKDFMNLPARILDISMKTHQKYFSFYNKNGEILPYFATISNVDNNNLEIIKEGNQKVLSARLNDAEFFLKKDLEISLLEHAKKLKNLIFHQELGSLDLKVKRIESLALFINGKLGNIVSDKDLIESAKLCKADLVTEIVGEFPSLQGFAGRYYAIKSNMGQSIADAIYEHYMPISSQGEIAKTNLGKIISIADKLDSLVGLWIAGHKPTGSKDSYALRRSSIGIIRTILESNINISLENLIIQSMNYYNSNCTLVLNEIIDFFKDRIKYYHRTNYPTDLVESTNNDLNIYNNYKNLIELDSFIKENGKDCLFSLKRISNLVKSFHKSDYRIVASNNYEQLIINLIKEYETSKDFWPFIKNQYKPIEDFLDNIVINSDNEDEKTNRLSLIAKTLSISKEKFDINKLEL